MLYGQAGGGGTLGWGWGEGATVVTPHASLQVELYVMKRNEQGNLIVCVAGCESASWQHAARGGQGL